MRHEVTLHDTTARVVSANLELYHLKVPTADWNLDVALEGQPSRLLLSGTVATPVGPGPAQLEIAFIDQPDVIVVDGRRGGLTTGRELALEAHLTEDRAEIRGSVELEWFAFDDGSTRVVLACELVAAVQRR